MYGSRATAVPAEYSSRVGIGPGGVGAGGGAGAFGAEATPAVFGFLAGVAIARRCAEANFCEKNCAKPARERGSLGQDGYGGKRGRC